MSMKQLFVVLSVVSVACQGAPGQRSSVRSRLPALHFLVVHDVSSSIDGRVPRLTPVELTPVLEYAEEHGGTVGVVSFGVRSRPSVRVVFDPPEAAEDDARVNVFLRRPRPDPEAQARQEEAYRSSCAAERERFLADVTALLAESAAATNLVAGLARAEVFFSEAPPASAPVLVVISDFEDTTGATSFDLALDPSVRVLLVSNDIRSFGILQEQASGFETFESVSAAIRAAVPGR